MKRWCLIVAVVASCSSRDDKPKEPPLAPPPKDMVRTMVVSAPRVKLRATASADGPVIATIPIGQRVLELEPPKDSWEHISTRKSQQGWISATEVMPLDNEHPEDTYVKLWRDRFGNAKLDFDERATLFDALSQTMNESQDHQRRAELELARILTLKAAVAMIDGASAQKSPHKEFIEANRQQLVFDESSAEWDPQPAKLWSSAKAFKDTASGEAIAWEAATTPLPGGCEGDYVCTLDSLNQTAGKYLELFADGRSAPLALKKYAELEPPSAGALETTSTTNVDEALQTAKAIVAKCQPEGRKGAEQALAKVQKALAAHKPPD